MDPNNTIPTEPNSMAGQDPSAAPAAPAPAAPTAPVSPMPSQPSPVAAADSTAVNPDVANAVTNPPVNPVVAPTAPVNPAPASPVPEAPAPGANPAQTMPMNQMFQTQPAPTGVISEATPIAVPEGPKAPDPVEEELKAPLKAAGPVPGSIGSAVSMPPVDGSQPQNVAPVDPANPNANPMTANAQPVAKKNSIFDKLMAKTKMSKSTLILLCVVAGLIVVALVVVLIMVSTGNL